ATGAVGGNRCPGLLERRHRQVPFFSAGPVPHNPSVSAPGGANSKTVTLRGRGDLDDHVGSGVSLRFWRHHWQNVCRGTAGRQTYRRSRRSWRMVIPVVTPALDQLSGRRPAPAPAE